MLVDADLGALAGTALDQCRAAGLKIATAESCTGGLIAALITSAAGSSDVFERGFVTYSNEAKSEAIGVPEELVAQHGAVSAEVAAAMARGALRFSRADIALSVTGIAGPGGGSAAKPVGLVYLGIARRGVEPVETRECRFGDLGRDGIRNATARAGLELLLAASEGTMQA